LTSSYLIHSTTSQQEVVTGNADLTRHAVRIGYGAGGAALRVT